MQNTLRYVKLLEEAGFTRRQAETHTEILTDFMDTKFATKQDMKDLAQDLRHEMHSVEYRIVIKLGVIWGTLFTIATGVLAITLKP